LKPYHDNNVYKCDYELASSKEGVEVI